MSFRTAFCAKSSPFSLLRGRPLSVAMPLRAKVLPGALARMSSSAPVIRELPNDDPEDVLFNSRYGVRTIELNRPKKLNSLNGSMARKIVPRLQEWEKSQLANVIILKGAGDRALCAGGDVAALAAANKTGAAGREESTNYFALEYQLDHLIATYDKPYVAFMDGITMGGGVGLSVHAPFRIATERTVFAMPETRIGFFPDVGGGFFLPRLDGQIGTYLALTSETLKGVQAFYAGIATHYLHSSSLPDLEARLADLRFTDDATLEDRNDVINETIEEFVTGLPSEGFTLSGNIRLAIDRHFRFDTIEQIVKSLEEDGSEWAQKTLTTMLERSPTSLRVTLRQLREGKYWSIAETFQREHYIAARFMEHPDFVEGVEARLMKPGRTPVWSPPTLEETNESVTDAFFEIQEGVTERLQLLKSPDTHDYLRYPHEHIGLPNESAIARVVKERKRTRSEIVDVLSDEYKGKLGLKSKVYDALDRLAEADEAGYLTWKLAD
ncbi:ClpP/crotonase [Ascodesmis nigricans]|uniref:3-hydroxyisobutyryl-CoA hydrolase n=1 Tax=Ascodesmis nigricans TaxID=341454 RepID=A0A4S2N1X8_9PEZI|nr:ClpP/crotonase [Ascodesmis nigricans]